MEIGRGWWFNRGLKSIFSDYKCVDLLSLCEEQAPGGPEADVPQAGGMGVRAGRDRCNAARGSAGSIHLQVSDLLFQQGEARDGEVF